MNKNKIIISLITISMLLLSNIVAYSQHFSSEKEQKILNSLETLDNEIVKYFPRWKVCEPNLQLHIYNIFKQAGYPAERLNSSNIEVLAAPGQFDTENGNYQILLVQCGDAAMQPSKINLYFTAQLRKKLSGEESYSGVGIGRTYCYKEIPPEVPVSTYQAEAIINYYQPTDVTHAISLSLFEQDLKLGESGFWLKNVLGNDDVGYQFWSTGQVSIQLQRPLYENKDIRTSRAIPYLISLYIGGGYRITTGLNPAGTMFSWVPQRILNASQSGDFVAGMDFHFPFATEFGISAHAKVPLQSPKTKSIKASDWGHYNIENMVIDGKHEPVEDELTLETYNNVVPIIQSSGRVSLFYNLWLDRKRPENYFRFDLGINYVGTREMALIGDPAVTPNDLEIKNDNITGLLNYKSEGLDYLYFKLEYRNQATWPFGVSLQISNQILLTKVWVPILGNWFLIEAKHSNVLRDLHPFELKNFFMLSPVIRITI